MGSFTAVRNVQAINRCKKGSPMTTLPIRFQLCPPFFRLQGMRVDAPTCNLSETYELDAAFFKTHRDRSTLLRPAHYNEFDIEIGSLGEWLQIPQLHVLVTKISVGTHLVTPVYRGKAFFREVTTDGEIAMIVADMCKLGGIDQDEFELYERTRNAQTASLKAGNEIVH
jgi:hypothetical protein